MEHIITSLQLSVTHLDAFQLEVGAESADVHRSIGIVKCVLGPEIEQRVVAPFADADRSVVAFERQEVTDGLVFLIDNDGDVMEHRVYDIVGSITVPFDDVRSASLQEFI